MPKCYFENASHSDCCARHLPYRGLRSGRSTRTQEDLIIEGSNLASVTAIQIMNGNLVLQTIQGSVVQTFINSHNQIIIPPGHISESTEGADGARQST